MPSPCDANSVAVGDDVFCDLNLLFKVQSKDCVHSGHEEVDTKGVQTFPHTLAITAIPSPCSLPGISKRYQSCFFLQNA